MLIYAPTMVNPGEKISPETVYKVFYPIIRTYRKSNISIACPGLGSMTGGVPLNQVAEQMKKAYVEGMQK